MTETPKTRGPRKVALSGPAAYQPPPSKPKRGRPTKEAAEAKKRAAEAEASTSENPFLDEVLARPIGARRTLLQLDDDTLRIITELAKIGATQKEIASVLGVADRTLKNFLYANESAYQAWEDGLEHAKISLRRKQLSLADKNAPMAIFLGKNMLGQKDEHHTNMTVSKPANEMTEEELLDIAQRARAKPAAPAPKNVH